MKFFQTKKEAGQENYEFNNWDYCLLTNKFKKSFNFDNMFGKESCIFISLLSKLDSDEYKIFTDAKKNNRDVYVEIIKELDDKQIDNILNLVDSAFKKANKK